MRVLFAVPLALLFACAGMSSSTNGKSSASAQSCGALVPALAYRGTEIYSGPDRNSLPLTTLKDDTTLCVSPEAEGFGMRRVQLANGRTGYVAESSLLI